MIRVIKVVFGLLIALLGGMFFEHVTRDTVKILNVLMAIAVFLWGTGFVVGAWRGIFYATIGDETKRKTWCLKKGEVYRLCGSLRDPYQPRGHLIFLVDRKGQPVATRMLEVPPPCFQVNRVGSRTDCEPFPQPVEIAM